MFDLLVQFLTQIGGGPGAPENNLVRFGLPAIFWAILFLAAWSRRREEKQPRESLLLVGFGLFFAREFFMFLHTAGKVLSGPVSSTHVATIEPLEHALAVSAVIVISAAFLRYILDKETLSHLYLVSGLAMVGIGVLISFMTWPGQHALDPALNFHNTAGGWSMHITKVVFIIAAMIILIRHKGWVRNVVVVALSFLLASVLLAMANAYTGRAYGDVICPISNNLHIWAVPIFGFVYFREQSLAKKKAERSLALYRGNLEKLVEQRTAELSTTNEQLMLEVSERRRAENAAEQWAVGMSRLNEISLLLNATLVPDEICKLIVTQAAGLLDCAAAGLFRMDEDGRTVLGIASYGMVEGGVDGLRIPVVDSPVLLQLISGNEPLIIDDVRTDRRIPESVWKHFPMRAVVGLPLLGTGEIQGILFLVEPQPRIWQTTEIRLLGNFANRAGVAWENAYLHKQLEKTAVLEERQRIAAEMHDGLAQMISTLALRNDQAAQMIEDGRTAGASHELAEIQDIISLAGSDLRRSINALREQPGPPCSLQDSIATLLRNDRRESLPELRFSSTIAEMLHLKPAYQDQITSIVQEALCNARKHSRATVVTVTLERAGDRYIISVKDDGIGFDVERAERLSGNHFGLSIMRARALRVGADLTIDSSPANGTRLLLSWPAVSERGAGQPIGRGMGTEDRLLAALDSEKGKILWQN